MNQVGPDHGFNAAKCRVNRGKDHDRYARAHVDHQGLRLIRPGTANHFVGERQGDGGEIQARAGGKQSRNHEDRRRGVLRRHAKPSSKVFVDGVNFVVVVRLEENVADENAREDGADCQLQIGVAAERESLTRGSEESCRSCLRGDE